MATVVAGKRRDPYRGYAFRVVDATSGEVIAGVHKITGLHEESEVTNYREGDEAGKFRKLPGLVDFDNVVLESGLSENNQLLNWRRKVFSLFGKGAPDDEFRKDLYIILLDRLGNEVRRWILVEAFPAIYEIDDLDAESSDPLFERVELAHEGWDRMGSDGTQAISGST